MKYFFNKAQHSQLAQSPNEVQSHSSVQSSNLLSLVIKSDTITTK